MLKEELKYFWKGARIIALFPVLYLVLLFVNHRFQLSDFNVYYGASDALWNGAQVYGKSFGLSSGFYKYSPEVLVLFFPFSWLKYDVAAVLFYLFNTVVILSLLFELKRVFFADFTWSKEVWMYLLFSLLFFGDQFERELFLGNVNALLLLLSLIVFRSIKNDKRIWAGVLFAVILSFKIHFIVLLPYFLLKKEFKVLLYTLLGIGALALLLVACVPDRMSALHFQWLKAIQAHNVQLDHSPNTIYFFVQKVLSSVHMAVYSWVAVLIGLSAVGLFYLSYIWKNLRVGFLAEEAAILVALIPLLMHTDTEHFLWAMPLVLLTIQTIFSWNFKGKVVGGFLLLLAAFPFLFNSPDLVGKTLSKQFDEGGIGLSLLLLFALALVYRNVIFVRKWFAKGG